MLKLSLIKTAFFNDDFLNANSSKSTASTDAKVVNDVQKASNDGFSDDNERCDNCILWDEIDSLKEELLNKEEKLRQADFCIAEYRGAEEKVARRLKESDEEADRLRKTALYEYATELRTIKLLSDKIKKAYGEELSENKIAITGLLTDLLKDVYNEDFLDRAKGTAESLSRNLSVKADSDAFNETDYDEEFDLDSAINPKGDLDLKTLLSEIGVFGNDE